MIRRWGTSPSAWITARSSGSPAAATRALSVRASSFASGAPLTSIGPRTGTITDRITCTASPWAACGRSRGTAGVTMIFAVTTKITSSTSMTSTSGVTLMPEIKPSLPWLLGAAMDDLRGARGTARARAAVGDIREHEVAEDLGRGQQRDDLALQVVVGSDRGQGDQNADRGRHDRLGGDLAAGCGCLRWRGVAKLLEGVDDAHDGAEQPDERRVVAHGGQV